MSTPRQPSRIAEYSESGSYYPRELVEVDGKLYMIDDDGTSKIHLNPSSVSNATEAEHATSADTATEAEHASTADSATHATSADTATKATSADKATTADKATEATHAASADEATHASTADEATHATNADSATKATSADSATTAGSADKATQLTNARTITIAGEDDSVTGFDVQGALFDGTADGVIRILAMPATIISDLAKVATSGSYNDLSDLPTIPTIPSISIASSGTGNVVTAMSADGHTITYSKGITALTAHPSVTKDTDATSSASPGYAGTFTAIDSVTRDSFGHVTKINTKTVTMPSQQTSVTGNAGTATKLAAAVKIGLTGVTATAQDFDGSKAVNIPVTAIPADLLTGTIDIERLPQAALERLVIVEDDTARLELTSSSVQNGDVVKVTGTGLMYYVKDDSKLGTADAFEQFTAGTASSVAWSGITGKPTFAKVATSGSYNDLSDLPTIPTIPNISVTNSGTGNVVSAISASGHALTVTKGVTALTAHQNIPSISVSTSGTGNAITALSASGHAITATKGSTFLTDHPTITTNDDTTSEAAPAHGGTFTAIAGVTRDSNGHVTTVDTKTVTLPSETAVTVVSSGTGNVVTALSASGHKVTYTKGITALTAHQTIPDISVAVSGTGNAVTALSASGHAITYTKGSTFALKTEIPTIPDVTVASDGTGNVVTAMSADGHTITYSKGITALTGISSTTSGTGNVVSAVSASGSAITVTKGVTALTKESDISIANSGTGNVVSAISASGHALTVTKGVTALTAHQSIPDVTISTSGTGNVISALSADGHTITATKGITALTAHQTIPDVTISTSGTGNAITALSASGHVITANKGSTFALSSDIPTIPSISITTSGTGNAVTALSASGHALTATKGSTFLTAHPSVSQSTDSTSTAAPAYGGTFTAIDSITRDTYGHVTKVNTKTITIPSGAATTVTYTATIGTSWTGSSAPYTQNVTVSGMLATDNPIVDVVLSDDYDTAQTQLTDYGKIYRITTAANSITVYANEATESSVSIQLKCIRS